MKNSFEKRISYILTTKNRAKSLNDALHRFKKIKTESDELIIIDGASTDNTIEIIEKHSKLIDHFISEPDSNPDEAGNKGFLLAKGKYIKQLADDDIYFSKGLEEAYKVMEKNPEVDMIVCGGIRKQGEKETLIYVHPGSDYGSSVDNMFMNGHPTSGMGVLFRSNLFYKVGLFETDRPYPDMGFILRSIYLGANVKFCRINMFYHPLSNNSITVKNEKRYNKEYKSLLNRYCSENYKKFYHRKNKFWYRMLSTIPKILIQLLSINKNKKNKGNTKKTIWDGGFG